MAMKSQEDTAQAIARVKGPECPAARALSEATARRAAGEDVVVVNLRGRWHVKAPDEASRMADAASEAGRAAARQFAEERAPAARGMRAR
jgi:hypothetical protein